MRKACEKKCSTSLQRSWYHQTKEWEKCPIHCNYTMVKSHLLRWKYTWRSDNEFIGLVGIVFANGPGDLGSIPGRVIPKTLKMVLDTSLLNTQQYKVHIKGKVEQSKERSSALFYIHHSYWKIIFTFQLRSYWKGSLLVALDYGRQLYFYVCIWIYVSLSIGLSKKRRIDM